MNEPGGRRAVGTAAALVGIFGLYLGATWFLGPGLLQRVSTLLAILLGILAFESGIPLTVRNAWTVLGIAAAYNGVLHFEFPHPTYPASLAVHACANFGLLLIAASGGFLLSRIVDERSYIAPALVVAALADAWSVFLGPTRKIVEISRRPGGPDLLKFLTFHAVDAAPGSARPEPRPFIGVVDFVLVAFLLCLGRRFSLPARRSVLGIAAGIAVGIAATHLARVGIPMTPFIGLGFIAAHGRILIPPREVALQLLGFILAVTGILGGIYLARWLA